MLFTGKTDQISCPKKLIDHRNCIFFTGFKAGNWDEIQFVMPFPCDIHQVRLYFEVF